MKKFLSIAAAGAIALSFSLAVATPSLADHYGKGNNGNNDAAGAAIASGVAGFIAGTIAAGAGDDGSVHYSHHDWRWRKHVSDCQNYWGWRYDPSSDMVHSHGHYFPCDLD